MKKIGILQNKVNVVSLRIRNPKSINEICKGIYVKVFPMVTYLFLSSCMVPYKTTEITTRPYSVMGYNIHVVNVEGCEYLVSQVGIVHKENCKNHKK